MYFEILETGDSLIALPYDHLYVNGHEFFSSSDEELIDAIIKYARIDLAWAPNDRAHNYIIKLTPNE